MATTNFNNTLITFIAIHNNWKRFTPEKLSLVNENFLNYVRQEYDFLTCRSHCELFKSFFSRYTKSTIKFPFEQLVFPEIDVAAKYKILPNPSNGNYPSLLDIWFENGIITTYKQLQYFENNPEKIFELPLFVPETDPDEEDQKQMILAYRVLQKLDVPVDLGQMFSYYDNYLDFISNGVDTYVALDKFVSRELDATQ